MSKNKLVNSAVIVSFTSMCLSPSTVLAARDQSADLAFDDAGCVTLRVSQKTIPNDPNMNPSWSSHSSEFREETLPAVKQSAVNLAWATGSFGWNILKGAEGTANIVSGVAHNASAVSAAVGLSDANEETRATSWRNAQTSFEAASDSFGAVKQNFSRNTWTYLKDGFSQGWTVLKNISKPIVRPIARVAQRAVSFVKSWWYSRKQDDSNNIGSLFE
jgi:hypothetical protein